MYKMTGAYVVKPIFIIILYMFHSRLILCMRPEKMHKIFSPPVSINLIDLTGIPYNENSVLTIYPHN